MENRLKERLTGAAILVALIVLVVPELFRGPQPPAVDRSAVESEAPPLRSLTIDLSGTVSPTTPRVQTSSNPLSAPTPASAPARAPPPAPRLLPTPAAPPVAARQSALHGGASAPNAAQRTAGWSVQLGLFSKAANAQRLVHDAGSKGFTAGVSRGSKGLYRVAIAGLADRKAAEQLSRRLHTAGLPAAIIGPR